MKSFKRFVGILPAALAGVFFGNSAAWADSAGPLDSVGGVFIISGMLALIVAGVGAIALSIFKAALKLVKKVGGENDA